MCSKCPLLFANREAGMCTHGTCSMHTHMPVHAIHVQYIHIILIVQVPPVQVCAIYVQNVYIMLYVHVRVCITQHLHSFVYVLRYTSISMLTTVHVTAFEVHCSTLLSSMFQSQVSLKCCPTPGQHGK